MSQKKEDGQAGETPLKIGDDTKVQSSLKFIITVVAACCILFGGWISMTDRIDHINVRLEKVDRLEQTVRDIRDTQIMESIMDVYKSQDRWTGEMQTAYNTMLWSAIQKINNNNHPEKPILLSEALGWPDVKKIQQAYPMSDFPKPQPKT